MYNSNVWWIDRIESELESDGEEKGIVGQVQYHIYPCPPLWLSVKIQGPKGSKTRHGLLNGEKFETQKMQNTALGKWRTLLE
jgi:hypothetical protein